jgi:cytochrome c oxidase subunit 3
MADAHAPSGHYYVPHESKWPFVGSLAFFTFLLGAIGLLNHWWSAWGMLPGFALVVYMFIGWFGDVIKENNTGVYGLDVDRSFRMGMMWFIFSEVMFFAAFFGALFYARTLALPWLGGEGDGVMTNSLLWEGFSAAWPSAGPGQVGGQFQTIPAWGLPLINTLILLTSGITITIAHHALKAGNRKQLLIWLGATVLLGCTFLYYQAEEYVHAYKELNLTLGSGIYGSTFFMLTGFHGAHVTLGTIMLAIIWFRCLAGHFSRDDHFAFEAVAWYWHFVDVVWLGLFVFVYWI